MITALFIISGLVLFEVVNSLDNAVVNADVLRTVKSSTCRKFFVTYGMFFSVFLVRGIVPFLIYWVPNRHIPLVSLLHSFFHGSPEVRAAVAQQAPYLLMAGGTFLFLLFLHWLIVEEKDLGFAFELWLSKRGDAWYYGIIGLIGLGLVIFAPAPILAASVVGTASFFIVNGIKEFAESMESSLTSGSALSDWSKILFLEVIDASFSVDGVVGAFAFTLVVPYILIGNGIGAYIVRSLTLRGAGFIGDYAMLANGAFYSIGSLSLLMILEGFGLHVPEWLSPLITFSLVAIFFVRSVQYRQSVDALASADH